MLFLKKIKIISKYLNKINTFKILIKIFSSNREVYLILYCQYRTKFFYTVG